MQDILTCSFCGEREEDDDDIFISGKMGAICPTCAKQVAIVSNRSEILQNIHASRHLKQIDWNLFKPNRIKAYLDDYVIGQDEAKKVLSVGVYNHYKRLVQEEANEESGQENTLLNKDVEIEKSNIVMLGATGSGKTYLLRTIARMLKVPFYIGDATSFTQAGYVGEDVESMLSGLLQAANYNIQEAERGLVYIDEFDKLRQKGDSSSITRDVGGEGVQQALLKIMEGAKVNVPPEGGRKHPDQKMITIDTRNILFICGGAFTGIERIIQKRLHSSSIGFNVFKPKRRPVEKENLLNFISAEDLKNYGLIPEIVGRLPIMISLNPLTRDVLKKILLTPKNALMKQYKKLFAMENIALEFTEQAIEYIIDKVEEQKLGARGLRNIMEKILVEPMFDLPSQKEITALKIDRDFVVSKLVHLSPLSIASS